MDDNKPKNSKVKNFEYEQFSEVYDGTRHLPSQLDSLNKIFLQLNYENDNESLYSLYHMYVYVLCSFCESLIRTTFNGVISKEWNNIMDTQHLNLIEQAQRKLESLSWENLKKEDITYLGVELPQKIKENESFKAINILFKLRNLLIHGNNFKRVLIVEAFSDKERYEISGRAKEVYGFFVEKGLISQDKIEKLGHYELSSEVVNYFIRNIIEFTKIYCEFLNEVFGLDYYTDYSQIGLFDEKYRLLPSK